MSDSPATSSVCRVCGAAIVPDAPLGQCPKCLVKLGLLDEVRSELRPDQDAPRSAQRFADYVLVRQIGRGGMGVVYEARHLHLRRSVALKVILDSEVSSPVSLRRFHIEAEAAAKLDHPHIVPIYEVGAHEDQPFLCMKLVQGESLRARIARGNLGLGRSSGNGGKDSWQERQKGLAGLVAKVARAVEHAHQHNVLHRDLKPGNILIDEQGEPYLTDFGLAKIVEEERREGSTPSPTVSGSILGTPGYMSPEQAAGGKMTAATDIYGLGAIFYELLTGHVPFRGNTPVETMRLVTDQPPKRPRLENPQIHPDLETICLKCLEKSPAARYGTAAGVAEDLERWLRREPIKARPTGPWLRACRWIKRNPVGAALILSLCLGLGATLFLLHIADREKAKARQERQEADYRRDVLIQQEWNKIESEWNDTNKAAIGISSEVLSVLGNYKQPESPPGGARRLTFAINITEEPVELATDYVPFLKWLERELSDRLDLPVLLDLLLCKPVTAEYDAIVGGNAHFQRMGALPYVLAKARNPGVRLTVREDVGKQAVIYVRRDLHERGVTNLPLLVGHSFAFGESNSTISLIAQIHLAQAGIDGAKLSHWKRFSEFDDDELKIFAKAQAKVGQDFLLPIVHSHQQAVRAVAEGKFDAGVGRRDYFEKGKQKGAGLVELYSFDIPGDVYVARGGLDPAILTAFRECLLALNDQQLLSNLPLQPLTDFLPTSDADYATLRSALTNEALRFETLLSNQSSK